MEPPRGRQDKCLIVMFVEEPGAKEQILRKLNRVSKHQEVVFISDIATASGMRINSSYMND